jgi:hypothetical protein
MSEARTRARGMGSTALAHWLHFVGLLTLGIGADVVKTLMTSHPGGASFADVLSGLPEGAFRLLPVVVAISIGMLTFTPAVLRQGIQLALAATILMAALDAGTAAGPFAGAEALGVQQGRYSPSRVVDPAGVSAIGTGLAFAHGELSGWRDASATYSPQHPRLRAALALLKGSYLLLPAILVGIVLGVQTWVAENVTFRTQPAERLARLLVAWIISPAAYFLALSWARGVTIQALLRAGGLLQILAPLIPFAAAAAIGWYRSWQAVRWLD